MSIHYVQYFKKFLSFFYEKGGPNNSYGFGTMFAEH
jgi:hypothetical protein